MNLKEMLPIVLGALVALVIYDKFVKDLIAGSDSFDPQFS